MRLRLAFFLELAAATVASSGSSSSSEEVRPVDRSVVGGSVPSGSGKIWVGSVGECMGTGREISIGVGLGDTGDSVDILEWASAVASWCWAGRDGGAGVGAGLGAVGSDKTMGTGLGAGLGLELGGSAVALLSALGWEKAATEVGRTGRGESGGTVD